jgi:hypothetical protein
MRYIGMILNFEFLDWGRKRAVAIVSFISTSKAPYVKRWRCKGGMAI